MPPVRLDPFRRIVGVSWAGGVMMVQTSWRTPGKSFIGEFNVPPPNMTMLRVEADDPVKSTVEDMGWGNPPFPEFGPDGNNYRLFYEGPKPTIVAADYERMWLVRGTLRVRVIYVIPELSWMSENIIKENGWGFYVSATLYSEANWDRMVSNKTVFPPPGHGNPYSSFWQVTSSPAVQPGEPGSKQSRLLKNSDSPLLVTASSNNSPVVKEILDVKDS